MARIFISHSSRDNFEAIAFRDWLVSEGWARDDVFLDLHGIGAGARWKEAFAEANERREAVLFPISPHALASNECSVEIRMAEDMGRVILPAILPASARCAPSCWPVACVRRPSEASEIATANRSGNRYFRRAIGGKNG
jgi:hypothetical protein